MELLLETIDNGPKQDGKCCGVI